MKPGSSLLSSCATSNQMTKMLSGPSRDQGKADNRAI
jgi:hypothetical protein